jgi:hypothetical protein
MDRRRFVPAAEGLEDRQLQATLFGQGPQSTAAAAPNTADTIEQKQLRVAHLPFYLDQFDTKRFLPADTIAKLQADLNSIVAELHKSPPAPLSAFNGAVRDASPKVNLSSSDAHALNHTFGAVLAAAGATPQEVANLRADMNDLAQVDANSPNPVFLATNDYSLVLQTALGVGAPIRTPPAPALAAKDTLQHKGQVFVTANPNPLLVGTYPVDTTMLIVNADGRVVGSAPVVRVGQGPQNGQYEATVAQPLPVGLNALRAVADDQGHLSAPSPQLFVRVVSKEKAVPQLGVSTPHGPLGLHGVVSR